MKKPKKISTETRIFQWRGEVGDDILTYTNEIIKATKIALGLNVVVNINEKINVCDNPHCEDGVVDNDMYGHPIYCQVCNQNE